MLIFKNFFAHFNGYLNSMSQMVFDVLTIIVRVEF